MEHSSNTKVDTFWFWVAGIMIGAVVLCAILTQTVRYSEPLHDVFTAQQNAAEAAGQPSSSADLLKAYITAVVLPSLGKATVTVALYTLGICAVCALIMLAFQPIIAPKHQPR